MNFDGIVGWWNNLVGRNKKKEDKKAVQPSTPSTSGSKLSFTAPTAQTSDVKLTMGKSPSVSTPVIKAPTAASTNKSVLNTPQTAPAKAPMVLTPEGRAEWDNGAKVKQNLETALRSNNVSDVVKYGTEQKYLKQGSDAKRAAEIGELAKDINVGERKLSRINATSSAIDTVSLPLRRASSGYLKSLAKAPSDIASGLGGMGQALAPDGTAIDEAMGNMNKWGVETSGNIDKFIDEKAKAEGDGLIGDVFEAGGQLAPDILISMIPGGAPAKAPKYLKLLTSASTVPAARYGLQETGQQYYSAKESGKSDTEAGVIATGAGVTQAALEKIGLDKFIAPGAGDIATRTLTRSLTEGSQEGAQQLASNAFEKSYNADKDLMDGVVHSATVGAIVGGGTGTVMDVANKATASQRDPDLPSVTTVAPTNDYERRVAIENGIVTPETQKLSVDEQVQTALNSDIRYRMEQSDANVFQIPKHNTADATSLDNDVLAYYKRQGYTSIQDRYGNTVSLEGIDPTPPTLDSRIDPYDINTDTVYHGTSADAARQILNDGYRVGSELPIDAYRGGGHMQMQDSTSFTTDPTIARTFATQGGPGAILEASIAPESNIVTIKGIDYAEELNDIIPELRKRGIDAIYLDGEKEVAVINPGIITNTGRKSMVKGTDRGGIVFYRLGLGGDGVSRSDMLNTQRINNTMFGDSAPNVDFVDTLETASGENALGMTTDNPSGPSTIEIARSQNNPQETYFHEAVHKALNDFVTQEERTAIMMSYAADKRVDSSMSERAIEELVAEDFIQYVAARHDPKLVKPSLTARIAQLFNKIFRRIQHDVAVQFHNKTLQPKYQQFYNDLYSGKFANRPVIDKAIRDGATAEQIALQEHRDMLLQQFNTTPDGPARQAINQQITSLNSELVGMARGDAKGSLAYRKDPTAALKQEALKYKTAEEFVKANTQAPMTGKATYVNGRNKDIAAGSIVKTTLGDGEYVVKSATPDGVFVIRKELIDAGIPEDQMPSPMRINPNEIVDTPVKVSGDVRTLKDKLADAGITSEKQLTDLYNQAHAQPQAPVAQPKPEVALQTPSIKPAYIESKLSEADYKELGITDADLIKAEQLANDYIGQIDKAGTKSEVLRIANRSYGELGEIPGGTLYQKSVADAEVYRRQHLVDTGVEPSGINPTRKPEAPQPEPVAQPKIEAPKQPTPFEQDLKKAGLGVEPDAYRKQPKDVKKAIDAYIAEENPQLAYTLDSSLHFPDGIPKVRPEDVRAITGMSTRQAGIPTKYVSRNATPIDKLAVDYETTVLGNVDGELKMTGEDFLDTMMDAIEADRSVGQQTELIRDLRNDPEVIERAKKLADEIDYKANRQTSVEYIADRMPKTIRSYYDEMLVLGKENKQLHPEQFAQLNYWLSKNSDALLNEYRKTHAAVYNERRAKRIKKFAEFTDSISDAAVLADLAPEAAKVEHINSKMRVLQLPGGDTMVKVDVTEKKSKAIEFAVAQTIDDKGVPTFEMIPMDNKRHILKNGVVIDKEGKSVGSYVSIEPDGTQIAYVAGKPVNITRILGDIEGWGNVNKATWDMDRLIEKNAPDRATATKVQRFTTQFKDQQEAMMKTELLNIRKEFQSIEKTAMKNRPRGTSKKQLSQDLFLVTEHKMTYEQLKEKYTQQFIDDHIKPTVTKWREVADSMLESTNIALEANGFDPIPRLDNYITHIQADPSLWEKVGIGIRDINPLGSSISSDITPEKTRNGVPDAIVGLTENTSARRRWNPFAQTRRGSQFEADFFKAVDSYFEPMLFNKYMTPAASRARVIERAFRTFDKAREISDQQKVDELAEAFGLFEAKRMVQDGHKRTNRNYKSGINGPFVAAWQEYGNMLAGKTNKIDRTVIDSSEAAAKVMRVNTKLQGLVGQSSIPGSASAALAQVLSIPQTIARDSAISVAKAVGDMVTFEGRRAGSKDPLRKSAFMRARYTDASSRRIGFVRRYTKAASVPMTLIERTVGEFSWRSAYHEALKTMPEKQAIAAADLVAKKTLAGRGIGDRPMLMNSKALGIFTQFGLEVNNMRLQVFNDFTPQQKTKFMFAAFASNTLFGMVTGSQQLPDYLGAILDTMGDFGDDEDDKKDTALDNSLQAFQRVVGETLKFVPGAATMAGVVMDDRTKQVWFGKNGDMERYGTPAISKVLGVGTSLLKGDVPGAIASAASLLPTGSQGKKTVAGVGALQNGYTTDYRGNVHNVYDNSDPVTIIKAVLFGKNSIPGEVEASNRNISLSAKQSEVFKKLHEQDPERATEYFDTIMGTKKAKSNRKGSLTDIGYGDKASASDGKIASVKLDDVIKKDDGSVDRAYYKDIVATAGELRDDQTYASFLYGYGLDKGTAYEPSSASVVASTGNTDIDKMVQAKSGVSLASNAVSLYKGSSDYKDIPDWVKERYYKEAGYTKKQVEYGALASFSAETKLDNYYRPIAELGDHQKLLDTLYTGRRKSIYKGGYIAAQDSIITSLYKEGYLSYAESKNLKSIKRDADGKVIADTSTGGTSGRKSTRGAGSKVTNADISAYIKSTKDNSITDALSIIQKYAGTSMKAAAPTKRSPTMRKMTKKRSKSKLDRRAF